jgi:hypothetical protein
MRVKATEDVRLAFDQWLWKPQPARSDSKGAPKRGTILVFDKDSAFHNAVKDAMNKVCAEKYQNAERWKSLQRDKRCLRTGEEQVDKNGNVRDYMKGKMLLVVKNPKPFLIVDADAMTLLTEESGRPYAGSYVRPIVDIYAFTVENSPGVFATIEGLQFSKDGDRLSAVSTATVDDFKPLAGATPAAGAKATANSVFD